MPRPVVFFPEHTILNSVEVSMEKRGPQHG